MSGIIMTDWRDDRDDAVLDDALVSAETPAPVGTERAPKRERLKTWSEPFQAIWDGTCTHTIRRMARPYAVDDVLLLREYDPKRPQHYAEDRYTGRSLRVRVTYVSAPGTFGLPEDLCVMSLQVCGRLIEGDRRLPPTLPVTP